jgi:lipid II isoglutaminyl synthase (glutamine-hydrolysing)
VAALGEGLAAQVYYYGLEDRRHAAGAATHIADSQFCRRCGAPYEYSATFYAHIGHYACARCGQRRPVPDFRLERLDLDGTSGGRLFLAFPGQYARSGAPSAGAGAQGYLEVRLPLPGLYNALNALAAAAAGLLLGVPPARIRGTLESFSAAFGRIERVDAGGQPLLLALIKNPVGASETVRMLTSSVASSPLLAVESIERQMAGNGQRTIDNGLHLLVAINDKHADGTDVSWLWDADFERLSSRVAGAVVSGTRAGDMAVRLKYAGVDPATIVAEPDLVRALDLALGRLPAGATLYVLPTYTAMLELRAELARRGWVRPFWED